MRSLIAYMVDDISFCERPWRSLGELLRWVRWYWHVDNATLKWVMRQIYADHRIWYMETPEQLEAMRILKVLTMEDRSYLSPNIDHVTIISPQNRPTLSYNARRGAHAQRMYVYYTCDDSPGILDARWYWHYHIYDAHMGRVLDPINFITIYWSYREYCRIRFRYLDHKIPMTSYHLRDILHELAKHMAMVVGYRIDTTIAKWQVPSLMAYRLTAAFAPICMTAPRFVVLPIDQPLNNDSLEIYADCISGYIYQYNRRKG